MPSSPVVYAGYVGNRVRLWVICETCRRQIFLSSMLTNDSFTTPRCTWCHTLEARAETPAQDERDGKKTRSA